MMPVAHASFPSPARQPAPHLHGLQRLLPALGRAVGERHAHCLDAILHGLTIIVVAKLHARQLAGIVRAQEPCRACGSEHARPQAHLGVDHVQHRLA